MQANDGGLIAIVLAGERAGGNLLARSHGLPAGALVPVAGRSCIARVVDALRASQSIAGGVLVGPSADVANGNTVIDDLLGPGDFRWIAPADGPSASALLALECNHDYPVLLTSGDHALLTAATIDRFCAAAREVEADFVAGLVPYAMVRAAYPETRRTVLRFQDGAYCGSNLYLVKNPRGHAAVQLWSSLEVARKTPWRLARRLGMPVLVRYLCRRLPLTAALERVSKMSTCTVRCTLLDKPEAAVDVDSADDWRLAERILSNG